VYSSAEESEGDYRVFPTVLTAPGRSSPVE
jgi:hypothetical protein